MTAENPEGKDWLDNFFSDLVKEVRQELDNEKNKERKETSAQGVSKAVEL